MMPKIDPTDPWLLQVRPGVWRTATDAELREGFLLAVGRGEMTLEQAKERAVYLLATGQLRANPGRLRQETMQ